MTDTATFADIVDEVEPITQPEVGVIGIYADWQGKTYPEPGPVSMAMIREMFRRDTQARGLLSLVTKPIVSALALATVTPADGDTGEAEAIKTLLLGDEAEGGPCTPLPDVVREMCLALRDGFSLHEIVWKIIDEGKYEGKLGIHKLAKRPAETIQWIVDKNGEPTMAHQRSHSMGQSVDVEIPIGRLLHFVVGSEDNPIYGRSYFEPAYYAYDKKTKMVQLMHLTAQSNVVPPRIVNYDSNVDDKTRRDVMAAAANMGMNLVIGVPSPGITIDALQKTSGNFPWMEIVTYWDSQMSKSILAMFFDKDQQSSSLVDMGGKDTGTSMFVLAVEEIMNDIQIKINKIVDMLARSNFPDPVIPTFEFHELTDDQREELELLFTKLSTAQALHVSDEFMLALEEMIAKRHAVSGLDYTELLTELKAQKAIADKMQQAELDALQNPAPGASSTPPPVYNQGPEALPSSPSQKPGLRQAPVGLSAASATEDIRETSRLIQLKLLEQAMASVTTLDDEPLVT